MTDLLCWPAFSAGVGALIGLVALIVGLDVVQAAGSHRVVVIGALDEPAHLATAALLLLAVMGWPTLRRNKSFSLAAMTASVAIDVDHLPLYIGIPEVANGGRPYSHSLLTVGLLLGLSGLMRSKRSLLAGAAVGVLLHLARDIATGPGLVLWWPLSSATVTVPYAVYLTVVVAAPAAATTRSLIASRTERGDASRAGTPVRGSPEPDGDAAQ